MRNPISTGGCTAWALAALLLAALAWVALLLHKPGAWAADSARFEAVLSLGTTRAAAVAALGQPDRETCTSTLGLGVCQAWWSTGGLLTATVARRATFVGGRLIATCQSQAGACSEKE